MPGLQHGDGQRYDGYCILCPEDRPSPAIVPASTEPGQGSLVVIANGIASGAVRVVVN